MAQKKYLGYEGTVELVSKIKAWVQNVLPTKTSELTNDSGFITTADIPEGAAASTTVPNMDGTAATGTEMAFARGDHVHPTDTSRAPVNSPAFTGTPTAPTASAGTNTTQIATTAFVTAAVAAKADDDTTYTLTQDGNDGHIITLTPSTGSPTTITIPDNNTEYNPATTSANGLMSATDKAKLDGIEAGATAVTVDSAINGTSTNPVENQAVSAALAAKAPLASPALTGTPTAPTAASGTNNTQVATTAFVTTAIGDAVDDITSFEYEVVASLPATGEKGTIYLVAHAHGTGDAYDEYMWINNAFEKIGNTDIDLSGYVQEADLVAITTSEVDAMFE